MKPHFLVVFLVLTGAVACEKTKPPTKAHAHKEGEAHDHKEGEEHKDGDDHEHKEGDGHDHEEKK